MMGRRGDSGASRFDAGRGALALAALLSWGWLSACAGSSTRGGNVTGGPVGEGDFVHKVADAVCGNLSGCCAAAGFVYDRAGCEAYVLSEVEVNRPPNTTWDSAAAGKCIEWFANVASSCN